MLFHSLLLVLACKILEKIKELITSDVGNSPAFTGNTPLYFLLSILLIQFVYPLSVTILVPLWSLSAEFYLNVLMVFLGFNLSRRKLGTWILLGILSIYFSRIRIDSELDWSNYQTWLFGFGRALVGFNLGQIIWRLHLSKYQVHKGISTFFIGLLFGVSVGTWLYEKSYILFPVWILFSLIIFVVSKIVNPRVESIQSKICLFFGQTSYGIYLIHPSTLAHLAPLSKFSAILFSMCSYLCAMCLAYISEKYFVPVMKVELEKRLKMNSD